MVTLFDHPYAPFLDKVVKPSRYTGAEHGVRRKEWDSVGTRVCLAFPDIYDIGMSHLGTKILYSLLNKDPRIACERAFAPWLDMEGELRTRGLPLVSLGFFSAASAFIAIPSGVQVVGWITGSKIKDPAVVEGV